jgi:beta-glucosidase
MALRSDFLWGASTAAHQVEGDNVLSDWWALEHTPGIGLDRSGDAVDHYHRYPQDMALLADAGLNAYRFSVEWARIETSEGEFSRAALQHYRRMIGTARDLGLMPVVTLHHFTVPQWFAAQGGWTADGALDRFDRYLEAVSPIVRDVEWVVTINEPNILALMGKVREAMASGARPTKVMLPDESLGHVLVQAHRRAVGIVRERTSAKVGWSVAGQALTPTPGNEEVLRRVSYTFEDLYLEGSVGDDFIGVQSYTSQPVDQDGIVPHPPHPDNTLTGWAYRPDALGIALRHTHAVTGGMPILITENGIATTDDQRRIEYTREALSHMLSAVEDGLDVRGYLHWSALDNFEWGQWKPTFGLIGVDRETFERHPKPSLAWLGQVAQANGALG